MNLYPIPHSCRETRTFFDYCDRRWLILPEQAGFELKHLCRELAGEISRRLTVELAVTAGRPGAGEVMIRIVRDAAVPPEGYRLTAGADGIVIAGSDDAGCYYGLLTAASLLRDGAARVAGCEIADRPDFAHRGYMLDISRCKVPTMATVKGIVDSISRLRYNELQLYIEFTFAFSADERVWAGYSPFTAAELMELDEYCRNRFVELVPNLNSFGHLNRWLSHEEYRYLAENSEPWYFKEWDVFCRGVIAPGEEALAFIDRLYAEFLPNFTSRRLNIGCDETVELGQGRSREVCEERGTTRVYLDFLKQLAELARKYDRKVQFWGDIIMHNPELISELPADVTALEWGYEANHPFAEDTAKFKAAKIPFYVCPGTSTWLSLTGRSENMIGNIVSAARNGFAAGASGLLLTDWGDGGHHQYWPLSWPGIALAAGAAWNAGADHEPLIPQGINLGFRPESSDPELGRQLLELGRVCEAFSYRMHNANGFAKVLYESSRKGSLAALEQTSLAEIRAAQRRLAKWRRRFLSCPPASDRLVLDELANNALLTELALENMAARKGARLDRRKWNDRMRHLIGRHRDLWLARNRVGGLHESAAVLEKMLK